MYSQSQVGVERCGIQLLQPYQTDHTDRPEQIPHSKDQSNQAHCFNKHVSPTHAHVSSTANHVQSMSSYGVTEYLKKPFRFQFPTAP